MKDASPGKLVAAFALIAALLVIFWIGSKCHDPCYGGERPTSAYGIYDYDKRCETATGKQREDAIRSLYR